METIFDQVSKGIREAMKAHDKARLEALRNAKKVFLEAKTAPGANDTLPDDKAMKILQKLVKQGEESADIYTKANRPNWLKANWHKSTSTRNSCQSGSPTMRLKPR